MSDVSEDRPFLVFGATGYTGRSVVEHARAMERPTVAHVRPDSRRRAEWTERFEALGATVDTSAWDPEAIGDAVVGHRPSAVFGLLGTTRARDKAAGPEVDASYQRVDVELTLMILAGAEACSPPPKFIYLSAAGVRDDARGAYMRARATVEKALRASAVPSVIARPSFITGPDRDEARAGERIGAAVADGALGFLAALGAKRLRDQWGSMTGSALARSLVVLAADPAATGIFEAAQLRERSVEAAPAKASN